ncbi:hypothetical protein ACOQFV_07655 [Nocardiopsis changdeensis]|uniref:CpsD/CapB family tyrosine-protein kinase n=1 Tax=Nocardiopsis changdeensis TaxID=2831969 RepID=A0ABX8BFL5_9ACTN|nr:MULTISPECIES: hypothetical protein [Nocardiopsis]QUX20560.1 hypothetical protein KGD84_18810 [Nocardiopsis changdeensis]QYX36491.1 hypothetical protein K1J57_28265 [Nocardiopsis sp. MT53]
MIIAVCSLSGAPGVTTLATALAAIWPAGPLTVPVLVEADVSGGDLAVWHRIEGRPGLVSLVASVRSAADLIQVRQNGVRRALLGHTAELPGGLRVLTAPATPHEATPVVDVLAHRRAVLDGGVTVLDLGRVMPGTAGARLLAHADAAVVTVDGDDPAQLHRVARCRDILDALTEKGAVVGLAVRGNRFTSIEIETTTGHRVWAHLPHDPTGAGYLRGERTGPRGPRERFAAWSHTRRDPDAVTWMPLLAAAQQLADRIDDLCADTTAARTAALIEAGAA